MKEFIKLMFSGFTGRISSKRVCGVIGWIVVLVTYIYCSVKTIQVPDITEFLIGSIVALLGVDSITSIFKKDKTNEKN